MSAQPTISAHLFGTNLPTLDVELSTPVYGNDNIAYPTPTIQTLTIPGGSTGSFRLQMPPGDDGKGGGVSKPIPFDTTTPFYYDVIAQRVEIALGLIGGVGSGGVAVSRAGVGGMSPPPSVFTITFPNGVQGNPAPTLQVVQPIVNGTGVVTTAMIQAGGIVTAGVLRVTVVLDGGDNVNPPTEISRLVELGPAK